MFEMHDGKLDSHFQYAIMSASFLYGTGTLAVVPQLHNAGVSFSWIGILTLGVIAIIFSFAIASAYTYQWFDYARTKLVVIESFYDRQKGDQSRKVLVWQRLRNPTLETELQAIVESVEEPPILFKDSNGVRYINWMRALGFITSNPRPFLSPGNAFARVVSMERYPYLFVACLIVSVSLGLCYSLSLLPIGAVLRWFFSIAVLYALAEGLTHKFFRGSRARLVAG